MQNQFRSALLLLGGAACIGAVIGDRVQEAASAATNGSLVFDFSSVAIFPKQGPFPGPSFKAVVCVCFYFFHVL